MEKNNFNPIGNRPLAPTIYDENITPLESMNKLAFKINKLIGDDTNVKEVVDKLLDVYASHMKLQGGYCEELKCIAFENPISCDLIQPKSPIYTPVKNIEVGVSNVKGDVSFYQWQYKNDNGLFVDLEADGSNAANCRVPVTFYNSGDKKEFRCKLQNDSYTYYTEAIVIEYIEPSINITQTYQNIGVNLYSRNKLTWSRNSGSFAINNKKWQFNNGSGWVDAPMQTDEIRPYYYIDRGTKTNGVSVGTGDAGTDKLVQWRFTCTNNADKSTIVSNVLTTIVHMVDFDCGSATVNGEFSSNWQETISMVQGYSYRNSNSVRTYNADINLSLNKELNSDLITAVQWLYRRNGIKWNKEPDLPTTVLENATNIDSAHTIITKASDAYIESKWWAVRLQVIVGNVAYYSNVCYCYFNLTECKITLTPASSQDLNSSWAVNVTPTGLLTDSLLQQNALYLSTESSTTGYKTATKGTTFTLIPTSNTEGNITIDSTKTPVEVKIGVGSKKTVHLQCKVVLSDYIKYYGYHSISIKS